MDGYIKNVFIMYHLQANTKLIEHFYTAEDGCIEKRHTATYTQVSDGVGNAIKIMETAYVGSKHTALSYAAAPYQKSPEKTRYSGVHPLSQVPRQT